MIIARLQGLLGSGNNNSEDTDYPTSESEVDEAECLNMGAYERSGSCQILYPSR